MSSDSDFSDDDRKKKGKMSISVISSRATGVADIAVIGLAVMGQNLILNMNDHGFVVSKVDEFLANEAKGTKIVGAHSIEEMCKLLKRPRRIAILVKAGAPVQAIIDSIVPFLEAGDIIIDSGNSEYTDSNVGEAGSGHFVKMVHNGIEYGDMQLIAEAHHLLKDAVGLNHEQMADVMNEWNKGELDSFLIEITANILRFKDEKGETLLPKIRDSAGQKGTGKWICFASLEYGTPVTLIGETVFARCLSALKGERVRASKDLPQSDVDPSTLIKDKKEFIKAIQQVASYAQGFMLLAESSKQIGRNLNYGAIALLWRGGCIIRSRFLGAIKKAFDSNPNLANLLLDNFFKDAVAKAH